MWLKVGLMERLKRRTDFQAAARGARAPGRAFVVQALRRTEEHSQIDPARVGFTVSKRVGNAVERNRVRRRLREIVRLHGPAILCQSYDYVLVGRQAALKARFGNMVQELETALRRVHEPGRETTGASTGPPLHEAGPPWPTPRRAPRKA
jgi:ribonuclease P protein component